MTRLVGSVLVALGLGIGVTVAWAALQGQMTDCTDQPFAEAQVPGTPRLNLELAITPDQRTHGLMLRQSLPDDQGMLFVFGQQSSGSFWNRNTLIPLSIAYIDHDGTILDIQDMRPQEEGQPPDMYPPAQAYWYALEVNQGWYANNGLAVGDTLLLCLPS
jgi:hypothetical protein